jgi:cobalt-zinc-cadmium efflux system protein
MEHHHNTSKGLTLAFWLNLLFSVVEVIGGVVTNSTAIIADAFHDFMDAMAIGAAVVLEKISGRKRTLQFSYGYKRFSLLSAIGMSLFLLVGAVLMVIAAVQSFIHPEPVNSAGMWWLAILGIVINGFAFLKIKKSNGTDQHAHYHEHSHAQENHNSKAIMLHLLEDVLGWIAVLIGASIIYFTGWYWIDGVLALGIAIFISYNAIRNLIATSRVLLQAVPANVDINKLAAELNTIEGVENIHDLHVWSLDGNYHVGSLHVVMSKQMPQPEKNIYEAVIELMNKYQIQHPTIQIETDLHNCKLADC